MDDRLAKRQKAGEEVERRILAFLMQFTPARELRVSDVQEIALLARKVSFDEFSSAIGK